MAVCAFRHENIPEDTLVSLWSKDATASICPNCLILFVVHRRVHHMRIEQLIAKMAPPEKRR